MVVHVAALLVVTEAVLAARHASFAAAAQFVDASALTRTLREERITRLTPLSRENKTLLAK